MTHTITIYLFDSLVINAVLAGLGLLMLAKLGSWVLQSILP
jgi:hypothetical protein